MPLAAQTPYHVLARALVGRSSDLSSVSGEEVLRAAAQHGLVPLLHEQVRSGAVSGLDATTAARLETAAKQQAAYDLLLGHGARRLLDRLAAEKIPVLLLKGAPLARLLYRQSYLRPCCDVDLYIAETDTARTSAVLADAGYRVTRDRRRVHSSKQFHASAKSLHGAAVHFDIHYRLSNRVLFRDSLPFEECWVRRQPIPSLGENARALSDVDLLLHACIHRIAHGRGSERNRLVWLYDIHLLWNALDEDGKTAFAEKALDKKIGVVCADALQVCDDLFGTIAAHAAPTKPTAPPRGSGVSRDQSPRTAKAPDDWLTTLHQNNRHEPTARLVEAGKLRWALADLWATPGFSAKFVYAKELVLKR